jgi:hypothetical protein
VVTSSPTRQPACTMLTADSAIIGGIGIRLQYAFELIEEVGPRFRAPWLMLKLNTIASPGVPYSDRYAW